MPELAEAYRAALAGEHRVLERPAVDGRERIWRIEFAPVRDQQGMVAAAMAVARDVTDKVRSARRFLLWRRRQRGRPLSPPGRPGGRHQTCA